MLTNNNRRRQVAIIVIFLGMVMLLGSLNLQTATASEQISLTYQAITIRDSTGIDRYGYLTTNLYLDHNTNQVTGTAELELDGNTTALQYNRVYEIGAGNDGRILELRGNNNGVPVMTTLSVSPAGIVVIAVLML